MNLSFSYVALSILCLSATQVFSANIIRDADNINGSELYNYVHNLSLDNHFANMMDGCTDPSACNYDTAATADDGSCLYVIDACGNCGGNATAGCTNADACN